MPELNLPAVIFYGTPEFAVPSLQVLVEYGFPVKAVVTAPDKPSGRGLHLKSSPVKEYALKHNLPVIQPLSLKDPDFLSQLKSINPGLQVVVAFRKLPEQVWQLPVLGTFNLHASMLPDYRGAAPINWTLINGDTETGLTTFLINENIDSGSLLLSEKVIVNINDNAGDLHDRLMIAGARLVLESAIGLVTHCVVPQVQPVHLPDGREPRPAPKISRETCRISWQKLDTEVYNQIRGLSPNPGAFSELQDDQGNICQVKIYSAAIVEHASKALPGSILTDGRTHCFVACGRGWIALKTVQLPGKKSLYVNDLLNGFPINMSWKFLV